MIRDDARDFGMDAAGMSLTNAVELTMREPMSTLQITLPDDNKKIADEQVASGRFASHSDYLRKLIEEDQQRAAQHKLESMLVSRVEGKESIEMDSADWKHMREEFDRRIASRGAK